MIVIDASLMIGWLIDEPEANGARYIYDQLDEIPIIVPNHWPVEIGNALVVNIRRKRIAAEALSLVQSRFHALGIVVDAALAISEIAEVARLAAELELTVYDALYVRLARNRDVPLATLDAAMRRAAQRLNIPLLPA